MFASVLDVLFPRRCLACRAQGWPFCSVCLREVAVLAPPGCRRCGRPLDDDVAACSDCPPAGVSWSRSAFLYEGPVRAALMRLKFSGWRAEADAFVPPMAEALERAPPFDDPVLTWVPLGARRRRQRGFDQAEVLAHGLGATTGLPCARLLTRTRETSAQARRTGAERRRALDGAFRAITEPPRAVVLVDDVLTSGATVEAGARALREAGARQVGVLTAARSLGGSIPSRCYHQGDLGLASEALDTTKGDAVELVLNGRGLRITEHHRRAVEHRIAKLERRPRPPILRVAVELIHESTPRIDGGHRVQMSCETPKRTFRAEGAGVTVDSALDIAFDRVERQISTYKGKRDPRPGGKVPGHPSATEPPTGSSVGLRRPRMPRGRPQGTRSL